MADPIRQLLSQVSYDADGVTTVWNFSFAGGYIERTHVRVQLMDKVTGLITQYPISAGNFIGDFQLQLSPPIAVEQEITIYRDTPKDVPLVNFADRAALTEAALDLNAQQAIFAAAEASDQLSVSLASVSQVAAQVDAAQGFAASASASSASASDSASTATSAAAASVVSAAAALDSQSAAASSESSASASAAAAAASQGAAAASAATASTQAGIATTGAASATDSAASSLASQNSASGSAAAAASSALIASDSATSAAGSATTASTQAGIATDKAAEAAASATSVDTAFLRARANHTGTQAAATIVGLTDWQANPTGVQSINGGRFSGLKNYLINGSMRTNQRESGSITNPASGTFLMDRWFIAYDGTGASRVWQQSAVPAGDEVLTGGNVYFTRLTQSAIGSTTFCFVSQRIEAVRTLNGRKVTLSFFARAVSGSGIAIRGQLRQWFGGSPQVDTYFPTTPITGAWGRYTLVLDVPSVAGKTIEAGSYLELSLAFPVDTTFAIDITGVQLEEGSSASPFESEPAGLELMLCQRYYQAISGLALQAGPLGGNSLTTTAPFPVTMRAPPTVTYTAGAGTGHTADTTTTRINYAAFPDSGGNIRINNIKLTAEL